jgi:hypothetical protein
MTCVGTNPVVTELRFPQNTSAFVDCRIGWAKWFAGAYDRASASGAFAVDSAMRDVCLGAFDDVLLDRCTGDAKDLCRRAEVPGRVRITAP